MMKIQRMIKVLIVGSLLSLILSCGSAPSSTGAESFERSYVYASTQALYQVIAGTVGGSAPDCTYTVAESTIDIAVTLETIDQIETLGYTISGAMINKAVMTFTPETPAGASFVKEELLTIPVGIDSSTTVSLPIATIAEKGEAGNPFNTANNPVTYRLNIVLTVVEFATGEEVDIKIDTKINYTDVGSCT